MNLTNGGDGALGRIYTHSKVTRTKLSLALKGRTVWNKGLKLNETQKKVYKTNYWEKRSNAEEIRAMLRLQAKNKLGKTFPKK